MYYSQIFASSPLKVISRACFHSCPHIEINEILRTWLRLRYNISLRSCIICSRSPNLSPQPIQGSSPTICNLCKYATICNYMTDRCGNFNFMQLNATICNCVGTENVYWHDNLSSCFNECRYHQIGIYQIYLPRVMIKI